MKVLVVDDSALDRRLAGRIITRRTDFEVAYAEDGEDALARIATDRPDVVLTDLLMPKLTGLQLVEQVRAQWSDLPVILMTAHGSEETAVTALRRGAASYVPKRNLAGELIRTLRDVAALAPQPRTRARSELDSRVSIEETFELDYAPQRLQRLLEHLESQLAAMEICDETAGIQVAVALREALVNATHHGNLELDSTLKEEGAWERTAAERQSISPYRERRVRVTARHLRGAVATYTVTDEGAGFDPTTLPDPTDPRNLEQVHGRGLMLIRTFMDAVEHNARGNEITMTKRATSPAPDAA
ncbi:MAG: response regulator [Myxococcota bacterium]